jgi:hypothetical protein
MVPVEPIAIGAALAGLALLFSLVRRRGNIERIHSAGGCTVRFDASRTAFTVEPPQPFPPRFELGFGVFERWSSGDPEFDRAVAIGGDDRWLRARMNAELRRSVAELARGSAIMIPHGRLSVRVNFFASDDRLRSTIELAVSVASAFAEPIDVPQSIAENAKRDPIAEVRRRCLDMLIRDHLPSSKQVAAEMLADVDPEVRLVAARTVGARAVSVLGALATDFTLSGKIRAQAIEAYVHHETFEEARSVMGALLEGPQPVPVKSALAKAVALIGGPFEPQMIAMLEYGDPVAQLEAIHALARIGTLAAVEPLLALAQRSGIHDEVRALARRTVGEIQFSSRGEGGRLSVVNAEGDGDLSFVGGGEVSLDEDGS